MTGAAPTAKDPIPAVPRGDGGVGHGHDGAMATRRPGAAAVVAIRRRRRLGLPAAVRPGAGGRRLRRSGTSSGSARPLSARRGGHRRGGHRGRRRPPRLRRPGPPRHRPRRRQPAATPNGHGTHVAGDGRRRRQRVRVDRRRARRIASCRCGCSTRTGPASARVVADGIRQAADAGATVINLSLGTDVALRNVARAPVCRTPSATPGRRDPSRCSPPATTASSAACSAAPATATSRPSSSPPPTTRTGSRPTPPRSDRPPGASPPPGGDGSGAGGPGRPLRLPRPALRPPGRHLDGGAARRRARSPRCGPGA